ncbi:MAG: DUF6531 domain-containing protein, partial [Anaerolineae bacterium]
MRMRRFLSVCLSVTVVITQLAMPISRALAPQPGPTDGISQPRSFSPPANLKPIVIPVTGDEPPGRASRPVRVPVPTEAVTGPSVTTAPRGTMSATLGVGNNNYGQTQRDTDNPQNHPGHHFAGPVNLVNGNFFLTAGDFFIPGRGMSLQLARSYNSLAAANGEQGAFGPGWTHSYETRVISKTGGMTVTVVEGDGARHVYTLNLSKPCATAACYDSPPGLYRELRVILGLGYQVIHKNGTIQQFEPDGRLVEIVDRNNNHINLYYSPACTLMGSTNALCRVNDTSTMRDLLFQYDDTSGI